MTDTTSTVLFTDLPDYLQFWHPALDDQIDEDYFSWGLVAPGSSEDRQLRVANRSEVLWANAVILGTEDAGAVPGGGAVHLLSADEQSWSPSLDVGDLPPLGVSGPVTVRRVVAADFPAGQAWFVLTATATSWGR